MSNSNFHSKYLGQLAQNSPDYDLADQQNQTETLESSLITLPFDLIEPIWYLFKD